MARVSGIVDVRLVRQRSARTRASDGRWPASFGSMRDLSTKVSLLLKVVNGRIVVQGESMLHLSIAITE